MLSQMNKNRSSANRSACAASVSRVPMRQNSICEKSVCESVATNQKETQMKSHDELFEEGNAAYHAAKPLSSNPYETGCLVWAAWREGWRWGEAHAET